MLTLGLAWILFSSGTQAEASWFIDTGKYLNSAHGDNACLDCHEDIVSLALHPDPANVNKKLSDFFSVEQCLACHDDVQDKLDQGTHGGKAIDKTKKYEDCIQCHDPHYQLRAGEVETSSPSARGDLSAFSEEDRACMACHASIQATDTQRVQKVIRFCFQCHARNGTQIQDVTAQTVPLINPDAYRSVPHAGIACLVCHPRASDFTHGTQNPGDCRQCHPPHDEKVAHDAHTVVSCQACHLKGVRAVRDPLSRRILWKKQRQTKKPLTVHEMVRRADTATCRECHFSGNKIGAAAMVLSPKSVLCMPCHAATFSARDPITLAALAVFGLGLTTLFSFILTGSIPGHQQASSTYKFFKLIADGLKAIFSSKVIAIIKALFLDVLLQRRLYKKSGGRWLAHSFIFLSVVFRFLWGLVALLCSLWAPQLSSIWFLIDKNNPYTAFLFDLSGILIFIGVGLAFARVVRIRSEQPPDLPPQDHLALGLIAGIVLIGFILEGMRIAMTGWPPGSQYAFGGYAISLLFSELSGLTQIYGFVWYLHAIFTGAFIAYLPFSRLVHIIMAPMVLGMNAATSGSPKKIQRRGKRNDRLS